MIGTKEINERENDCRKFRKNDNTRIVPRNLMSPSDILCVNAGPL